MMPKPLEERIRDSGLGSGDESRKALGRSELGRDALRSTEKVITDALRTLDQAAAPPEGVSKDDRDHVASMNQTTALTWGHWLREVVVNGGVLQSNARWCACSQRIAKSTLVSRRPCRHWHDLRGIQDAVGAAPPE